MTQVNVALLGLGNVGRAFARYIRTISTPHQPSITIRAVADSSGGLVLDNPADLERVLTLKEAGQRLEALAQGDLITDPFNYIRALSSQGVSLLVESLPTNISSGEPALGLIAAALEQRTSVVTVDKGPLVHGFEILNEIAVKSGARIGYSGTTGVSVPEELAGDRVLEIRGVLNGTTNYILTEMQQKHSSFDKALEGAQAEGIAEPDPSLDVQGWDTVSKTLILAKTLMGAECNLDDVSRIGIGPETESLIEVARRSGRVVRLVGRARIWNGRVRVSVAPKLVEQGSPFYSVSGTSKVAVFRTERQGLVL